MTLVEAAQELETILEWERVLPKDGCYEVLPRLWEHGRVGLPVVGLRPLLDARRAELENIILAGLRS